MSTFESFSVSADDSEPPQERQHETVPKLIIARLKAIADEPRVGCER